MNRVPNYNSIDINIIKKSFLLVSFFLIFLLLKIVNITYSLSENILIDENKKIISNIYAGMTVNNLMNKIETDGDISVFDTNNKIIGENERLKTGYILKIVSSSKTVTYKISVTGDVDGNGVVDTNDVKKISKHRLHGNVLVESLYAMSADMNKDNKIDINDIILAVRYKEPAPVPPKYIIKYNTNGGAGTIKNDTKTSGETLTLSSVKPTRAGYTFLGWSTSSSATEATYTSGGKYTTDASTTLYAVWTNYTLGFNFYHNTEYAKGDYLDTGYKLDWDRDFKISLTFKIPTADPDQRYLIIGGYNASDTKALNIETTDDNALRVYIGTGQIDKSSGTITPGENVNLVFTWNAETNTYNITAKGTKTNISFKGTNSISGQSTTALRVGTKDNRTQGSPFAGKIDISLVTIYRNQTAGTSLSNISIPNLTSHNFVGWFDAKSGGNNPPATMPNKNIFYYGRWEKKTYTVSYNVNGGAGTIKNDTKTYGTDLTLSSTIPTREGYTFLGWATSSSATSATYKAGGEYTTNASTTLYAVWKKNEASCVATTSQSNVTSSGIQTHCITQTCTNSKLTLTNNSSDNSITCKSGYTKKYYLQNTTCGNEGDSCSSSKSTSCKQEWYYSCEPIYTLINVPIDSRPVTRSNFEYVVRSVGFNYQAVNSGLDGASNSTNSGYNKGNYQTVINQTKDLVASNNNKNSIAIINTTSYFFNGLTESRGYTAYDNMDSKIASLKSLLTTYTNPRYYVTFIIPRTRPDGRAIDVYENNDSAVVLGLRCYYDMSKGVSQSNCNKTNFQMATMEWAYLKSLQKHNPSAWNSAPAYVKNFYNYFVNTYTGSNAQYKEGGVSAPVLYESVFTKANSYLNKIFSLKSDGYIDEIVIGTDDFEIPDFISSKTDTSWIPLDSNKYPIKYSFAYDLYNQHYSKKSETINFLGTDEINNIIFARELVKIKKKAVKFNYTVLPSMNVIDQYDRMSDAESVKVYINFVNHYGGSSYFSKPTEIQFIDSTNSVSSLVSSIQKSVDDNSKNVFALQVNTPLNAFSIDVLNGLNNGSRSAFEVPAISGWNTLGNALGIGLSRAIAYTVLEADLSLYDVSNGLRDQLINHTKTQMIAVLEDSIYNSNKDLNNLNNVGKPVINQELNNVNLSIGRYNYYVTGASFSATQPWNRAFEPYIIPTIGSIYISEKK